jgi:hypothetical protein
MTWLAWRQFRTSAIIAAIALAVMAVLLAVTTHGSNASCAVNNCLATDGKLGRLTHDHLLQFLSTLLVGLPAIVAAFWGAPLVAREVESGTHRLAWTQSVTRTRWLTTKLVLIGLAGAVLCGLLSAMLGWWSTASINRGRIAPAMFAERGIVPIGYAVFALALGVAAGAFIRRTVPAMVTTLIAFTATRMVIQFLVRAHLLPLRHLFVPVSPSTGIGISLDQAGRLTLDPISYGVAGGWTVGTKIVDSAGHAPTSSYLTVACRRVLNQQPPGPGGRAGVAPQTDVRNFNDCIRNVGLKYHEVVTYQPASHYWGLQLLETGIFLAMAAALVGLTFWAVRRRLT